MVCDMCDIDYPDELCAVCDLPGGLNYALEIRKVLEGGDLYDGCDQSAAQSSSSWSRDVDSGLDNRKAE